jgi:dTDP-4-amino-4,6-dideoxygalactose transaminase
MSGQVPFLDLGRMTAEQREEIDRALAAVLDSGRFVLGTMGTRFEEQFAELCDVAHGVGVASGTDAIEVALRGIGVGPGDEVVTQANTCVPTVAAIVRAGATPVLCDAEPDSARMDPSSLETAVGPRTRAVIPVHLYGQCADLERIGRIASAAGVELVEDCAQAHAATFDGRGAGSVGRAGCFSFYPSKNLGALGDGGLVVTSDSDLAEQMRGLRTYGPIGESGHRGRGVNSRLDELQAAVLLAKLPRLAAWTARRRAIAARYDTVLGELDRSDVRPLLRDPRAEHVFHLYVVRASARDACRAALRERGVETIVHYPLPIHGHETYRELGQSPVSLAGAERLADEVVSLPLNPQMSDAEIDLVAEAVAEAALSLPRTSC